MEKGFLISMDGVINRKKVIFGTLACNSNCNMFLSGPWLDCKSVFVHVPFLLYLG